MPVQALLGYARVSTIGQDLHAQLAAPAGAAGLTGVGVHRQTLRIGQHHPARPGRHARLRPLRGDTVVVAAIDRLGRFVAEVTRTIAELGERAIRRAPYERRSTPPPRPVGPSR